MMLADKIMQERKKKGWSQEELAEQLDVSRQSVSKWEGGLSVPDLDKIIAMSEIFGVSTDYLLKNEGERMETETADQTKEGESARVRCVTFEEGVTYMNTVARVCPRIALGVAMCILSPVVLILLCGLSEFGYLPENLAVGVGLLTLFLLVGGAVALFIPNGMKLSPYEYLEKEVFSLDHAAQKEVEARQEAYAKRHVLLVTLGTLLCLVGVVPLVVLAAIFENDLIAIICVCGLLLCVSIGVFFLVCTSFVNGSYLRLLQQGEFSRGKKDKDPITDLIETAYWCIFTAIYLLVSFLTGAWHVTWVIWVAAGVLSPILDAVLRNVKRK